MATSKPAEDPEKMAQRVERDQLKSVALFRRNHNKFPVVPPTHEVDSEKFVGLLWCQAVLSAAVVAGKGFNLAGMSRDDLFDLARVQLQASEATLNAAEALAKPARKRGRKPGAASAAAPADGEAVVPKRRGRPPKTATVAAPVAEDDADDTDEVLEESDGGNETLSEEEADTAVVAAPAPPLKSALKTPAKAAVTAKVPVAALKKPTAGVVQHGHK